MSTFLQVFHEPMDSPMFRTLSDAAQGLWLQFCREWMFESRNETRPTAISFVWSRSISSARETAWNTRRAELEAAGFIECIHRDLGQYRRSEAWRDRTPTIEQQSKIDSIAAAKEKRRARSATHFNSRVVATPNQNHTVTDTSVKERFKTLQSVSIETGVSLHRKSTQTCSENRYKPASKIGGDPKKERIYKIRKEGSPLAACNSQTISPEERERHEVASEIADTLGLTTPEQRAAVRAICESTHCLDWALNACDELAEEACDLDDFILLDRFRFRATHSPEERERRYARRVAQNARNTPIPLHTGERKSSPTINPF